MIQSTLLNELRCCKVENLDDERSNEIGNEGGASVLVFFGMQVELALPLVPPQDDVLKDKRCYDKILSDWNFRPPSNVFW